MRDDQGAKFDQHFFVTQPVFDAGTPRGMSDVIFPLKTKVPAVARDQIGPPAEEIDITGIIHHIHSVSSRRADVYLQGIVV